MRTFATLWKRELMATFLSPTAGIVAVVFLLVCGATFWALIASLASGPEASAGLVEVGGWLFVLTMSVVAPLLTMRLFAEEYRSGTYETLMTAPVTTGAVVTAKFCGVLTFYLALLLPTLAYGPLLRQCALTPPDVDPATVMGMYFGAVLIGGFFLSLGLAASALTRSHLAAGLTAFAWIALFLLAGLIPYVWPVPGGDRWATWLSPIVHMADFARGILDSRFVVFYLVNTLWVLFVTERLLEFRRWA